MFTWHVIYLGLTLYFKVLDDTLNGVTANVIKAIKDALKENVSFYFFQIHQRAVDTSNEY